MSATESSLLTKCACGASLTWEIRETYRGQRALALCSNPDCGNITNESGEECLQSFLLEHSAPSRYLKPWARFYFRTGSRGFQWQPHHQSCWVCRSELVSQIKLVPLAERPSDPYELVLCPDCGQTTVSWWTSGERVVLAIEGNAWNTLTVEIRLVKSVFEERTPSAGAIQP